jgi:hypothetical protein
MAFKVDDDVPIPAPTWHSRREPKYPFATMKVGQSFFASGDKEVRRVSAAASRYAREHEGVAFTTRKIRGGIRCWRIRCKS